MLITGRFDTSAGGQGTKDVLTQGFSVQNSRSCYSPFYSLCGTLSKNVDFYDDLSTPSLPPSSTQAAMQFEQRISIAVILTTWPRSLSTSRHRRGQHQAATISADVPQYRPPRPLFLSSLMDQQSALLDRNCAFPSSAPSLGLARLSLLISPRKMRLPSCRN